MSENKEEIKTEISADNTASEYEVINIPISDGTEREFAIMDTFEVEGKNYMAVVAPKAAAGGKKAKKDADKTAETK